MQSQRGRKLFHELWLVGFSKRRISRKSWLESISKQQKCFHQSGFDIFLSQESVWTLFLRYWDVVENCSMRSGWLVFANTEIRENRLQNWDGEPLWSHSRCTFRFFLFVSVHQLRHEQLCSRFPACSSSSAGCFLIMVKLADLLF